MHFPFSNTRQFVNIKHTWQKAGKAQSKLYEVSQTRQPKKCDSLHIDRVD